jgi:hypothetical protein
LELGQKGDLFYLKLSSSMPSLENFGQKQDLVSAFSSLKLLNQFGKHLEIGKAFEAVLGPAQFEQSHPAPYLARHSSHFSSAPTRPSVVSAHAARAQVAAPTMFTCMTVRARAIKSCNAMIFKMNRII